MDLLIVESPTKAKTISKFIKGIKVVATGGHIRDLPRSKIGVDVDHNFEPTYVRIKKTIKHTNELKKLVAKANHVYLASDFDREGEAIAWHVKEVTGDDPNKFERITFHEITESAIKDAIAHPRAVDMNLVDAQQGRRVLDRLVGYNLSPFLWKKIARGLSAGRVQSVAVRLIVEREREILAFVPTEYWQIFAKCVAGKDFKAQLISIDDKKLAKFDIKNEDQAKEIKDDCSVKKLTVADVEVKKGQRAPSAPFITSSLQQEANRKLGYSAKKTMIIAQHLYEGIELGEQGSVGLITYMRTDSVNLAAEAISFIGGYIKERFGVDYLPEQVRVYKGKVKRAQEAHEAIRPTDVNRDPASIKMYLQPDEYKVYDLIWKRTVACQMRNADVSNTSILLEAKGKSEKKYTFKAGGVIIDFLGFLKVYEESVDHVDEDAEIEKQTLPKMAKDQQVELFGIDAEQKFTKPAGRFTEATLVKALEEEGIGRPSTYAPIMSTIRDRGYMTMDQKHFVPTEMGFLVNDLLVAHFPQIVDIKFTANMEDQLDQVAEGNAKWQKVIGDFYAPFIENLKAKELEVTKEAYQEKTNEKCPLCSKPVIIKFGRFGKFYACSGYPECKYTKQIEDVGQFADRLCSKCGAPMAMKKGRFGTFLGCTRYPDCKNIEKIEKTIGVICTKCGGKIVEKRTKKGRIFWGCSNYPKCDYASWYEPTSEKCPTCGELFVLKKGAKTCLTCKTVKVENAQAEAGQ